jgi:hypothetical protein
MNSGRALHSQVTLRDGRVLVVGGAQRDAELYDPAKQHLVDLRESASCNAEGYEGI